MIDYLSIWERWLGLSALPKDDGIVLIERLHEETRAGIEMISKLAVDQMAQILEPVQFAKKDIYLQQAGSVVPIAVIHAYCLFLISRDINPLMVNLPERGETEKLGGRWIEGYRLDGNATMIEKIDPMLAFMVGKIAEIRINQLLGFVPEVVYLPYKITEKLHQYVTWATFQGFILGMLEAR